MYPEDFNLKFKISCVIGIILGCLAFYLVHYVFVINNAWTLVLGCFVAPTAFVTWINRNRQYEETKSQKEFEHQNALYRDSLEGLSSENFPIKLAAIYTLKNLANNGFQTSVIKRLTGKLLEQSSHEGIRDSEDTDIYKTEEIKYKSSEYYETKVALLSIFENPLVFKKVLLGYSSVKSPTISLVDCKLDFVDFSPESFEDARISSLNFNSCDFWGASFENFTFSDCRFSNCNFFEGTFLNLTFNNCNFMLK